MKSLINCLSVLTLTVFLFNITSCYDDTELQNQIETLNSKVAALELLTSQMNTNIATLQTTLTALQNNDYVTSVNQISEAGKVIGYVLAFTKIGPVTIYHGVDGRDGQDDDNVYLVLANGTTITLPKQKPLSITFSEASDISITVAKEVHTLLMNAANFSVNIDADIDYMIEIPESASTWLTLRSVTLRSAMVAQSINFELTENTEFSRYAIVSLKNNAGVELKTIAIVQVGKKVEDADGNIYTSVVIGNQQWFAENLKTTKYNDYASIPNVTDTYAWRALNSDAYCWYNNEQDSFQTWSSDSYDDHYARDVDMSNLRSSVYTTVTHKRIILN